MRLAGRLKKLEAQRRVAGVGGGAVDFEFDAIGEPIRADVTRWDGQRFALDRASGEAAEAFQLRAGAVAGDLASTQAYAMAELRRVHGEG